LAAGFEPAVYRFVDCNVIFIKPGIVYSSMCRRLKITLTMTFVCYLLTLKTRGRIVFINKKGSGEFA
jgi:hypothetical protein